MANVAGGPEYDAEMRGRDDIRDGELALPFNPAKTATDARLLFIGRVVSPWKQRADCPKNMAAARETGQAASLEIFEGFRAGLAGLEGFSHAIVLTWFDRAARDLIVQKPRHAPEAKGVFALRSPVRPNPVGLHVVRILRVDPVVGVVELEAIDALDGTPIVDLKPYFASVDSVADATRPVRT